MYQTSAGIKLYAIVSMAFLSCEILVPLFQKQSMMFSTINGKSPATAIQLMISEKSEQRLCVKMAGFFLLCVHHDKDAFARPPRTQGTCYYPHSRPLQSGLLSEIKSHQPSVAPPTHAKCSSWDLLAWLVSLCLLCFFIICLMWTIFKVFIEFVLCFVFLAARHVGS